MSQGDRLESLRHAVGPSSGPNSSTQPGFRYLIVEPLEANNAVVTKTVNLWDAVTFRGQQPRPLRSFSLPAAVVRATVVLPRSASPDYMRLW